MSVHSHLSQDPDLTMKKQNSLVSALMFEKKLDTDILPQSSMAACLSTCLKLMEWEMRAGVGKSLPLCILGCIQSNMASRVMEGILPFCSPHSEERVQEGYGPVGASSEKGH